MHKSPLPLAVVFDMDGTLVDRETLVNRATEMVLSEHGVAITTEQEIAVLGRAWQDTYEIFDVADKTGWDLDEFCRRALERHDELVASGEKMTVLTGGPALIKTLHQRGIRVVIVSGSTRAEVDAVVAGLELEEYLEFWMGSEDYTRGKPDPEPYLIAAERLGIHPSQICVFEDSEAGIRSANAAGMRVVANSENNRSLASPVRQDLSEADTIVDSLDDVVTRTLRVVPPDDV